MNRFSLVPESTRRAELCTIHHPIRGRRRLLQLDWCSRGCRHGLIPLPGLAFTTYKLEPVSKSRIHSQQKLSPAPCLAHSKFCPDPLCIKMSRDIRVEQRKACGLATALTCDRTSFASDSDLPAVPSSEPRMPSKRCWVWALGGGFCKTTDDESVSDVPEIGEPAIRS